MTKSDALSSTAKKNKLDELQEKNYAVFVKLEVVELDMTIFFVLLIIGLVQDGNRCNHA